MRLLRAAGALRDVAGGYDYGTGPADRKPPRAVTFFEVTDETEQGVRAIETGFSSEVGNSVGIFYAE